MRVKEAIELHNERQRAKNIVSGREETYGFIIKYKMGRHLWPKQKGKSPGVKMSQLISGKFKIFKVLWVYIICKLTGVDANFLFRQKSEHDNDFNKLVK